MKKRRIGRMELSDDLLLDMLKFQGGKILKICPSPNRLGVIELMIEHKDMPDLRDDGFIDLVTPSYIAHYRKGVKTPSRITRVKGRLK